LVFKSLPSRIALAVDMKLYRDRESSLF